MQMLGLTAEQISPDDNGDYGSGAELSNDAVEVDDSDRESDWNAEAEKDRDSRKSASLWMDTLAAEECFTFSDKMTAKYYAFSTPWQLEQALIYGYIVILYVRKQVYGWLNALTAHIKIKLDVVYVPKFVFASLSNIRFDALQTLFPEARAFYCNFYTASHVKGKIQSFMKTASKGNSPEAKVDTTEMMKEASRQFKEELMKEEDPVTATANLKRYRRRWKGYQFLQFLESDYSAEDKKRRWMYAIREDRVIQALARQTDRKFKKSIVGDGMTLSGHKSPSKDDNLRNYHAAKETKDAGHSSTLITRIDRSTIGVKSLMSMQPSSGISSPTMYNIVVGLNDRLIFSCSCRYFLLFRRPCKHIELVKIEYPSYTFEIEPAFAKSNFGPNPQQSRVLTQGPSATSAIEPTVQASTDTETSPASRAPCPETAPVTHFTISDPRSPSPEPRRSPPRQIQASPQYSLPDVVSPKSTSGSSGAASKRRLPDLDRGSRIIVEPARASAEVSPAAVAMIKNSLETIKTGTKDLPSRSGIEARLAIINALLDKSTRVQEKKRRLE
ncbi:hypothetical protein BG006_005135 [Podila minutissima]|uniref:SWIM-type domain-containing protein n=1 Tax=Podila minutissima TaxID=64525 RepID=A0A9P5VM92_9FUNG|nr:hypothetical protein BG006_005135 [Podila minutissima]